MIFRKKSIDIGFGTHVFHLQKERGRNQQENQNRRFGVTGDALHHVLHATLLVA